MKNKTEKPLSRREWLRRGALGTATVAAGSAALASLRHKALGGGPQRPRPVTAPCTTTRR